MKDFFLKQDSIRDLIVSAFDILCLNVNGKQTLCFIGDPSSQLPQSGWSRFSPFLVQRTIAGDGCAVQESILFPLSINAQFLVGPEFGLVPKMTCSSFFFCQLILIFFFRFSVKHGFFKKASMALGLNLRPLVICIPIISCAFPSQHSAHCNCVSRACLPLLD